MNSNTLIQIAEQFGRHKRLSLSSVGVYAAESGSFFTRIKSGKRTCTLRKIDSVLRWFSANWPQDKPWPEGVHRPDLSDADMRELVRVGKRDIAKFRKLEKQESR